MALKQCALSNGHLVLFGDYVKPMTMSNDRKPMTTCLHLVVTITLSRLVFEILTTITFSASKTLQPFLV